MRKNIGFYLLIICVVASVAVILFPFWVLDFGRYQEAVGYGFLFLPPDSGYSSQNQFLAIEAKRSAVMLAGIGLVAAISLAIYKSE